MVNLFLGGGGAWQLHLDLAARALRADLAHCRTSEEGVVNLQDGNRLLPYLRSGSLSVTEPEGAEVSEWSTLSGVCHTLNSGK